MQPQAPYGQPPMQQQPYQQQRPVSPMQPQAQPQQAVASTMPGPGAGGAPTCPRCGSPLQFVAQYQRWFCSRENQYV
jgi:hypothetical protein